MIIISLGGSLIVPNKIDTNFLKKFKSLILEQVKKGKTFILICGGGSTSRSYQRAASKLSPLTRDDLDWIGIHTTRLNAHLLRTIFRKEAHPTIIKNPNKKIPTKKPILIAAGWKPGFSTDYDAVLLAKTYHAQTILNLTNIDYVYDKDPKKHRDAKPLKNIQWKEFIRIVGKKWNPGLNTPFDPVASPLAKTLKLKVIILNGKNTKNLEYALDNKPFKGTAIF